jgi:hypothetical protein
MPAASFVSFASPITGLISLLLALAAMAIAIVRRLGLGKPAAFLMGAGLLLLAAAAFDPIWNYPHRGTIAVMVDLSPSTRGARYRNIDLLRQRIGELIGSTDARLIAFAQQNRPLDLNEPLEEMPADRTIFSPPAEAAAVLLFSDGQFDPPAQSPAVYFVVDPALENPADAAVKHIELRGRELEATVANTGGPREATIFSHAITVAPGTQIIRQRVEGGITQAAVQIAAGDLWPENDSLSISRAPPEPMERWWIGPDAPSGWRSFSPANLPAEPEPYLAPAVVAIANQPAPAFSAAALDRLQQYVRDLGGSLLLLGGDHAFAAGDYPATPLEQLSPLASLPPEPTRHWILLIDASGSMAQPLSAGTRWQAATRAAAGLLPTLPPADNVTIGQFSNDVRWWLTAPATEAARTPLPPADAFPHGPTNLEAALEFQAMSVPEGATTPTELIVISDCDAKIDHAATIAAEFVSRNLHLSVLAIAPGSGAAAIAQISAATGGRVISESDPLQWLAALKQIAKAAQPPAVNPAAATVAFIGDARALPPATAINWNRLWLKNRADAWAVADSEQQRGAVAANWHIGSGTVTAVAFTPDPNHIALLADLIGQRPHDPRFNVSWEESGKLRVTVDAIDGRTFLNNLNLELRLETSGTQQSFPLAQTAPGRYELQIDSPRANTIAGVAVGREIIARRAVAGRYPPEFEAIGNYHTLMQTLAAQTGGDVITPDHRGPIDIHWPAARMKLAPWLIFAGCVALATGLVITRRPLSAQRRKPQLSGSAI